MRYLFKKTKKSLWPTLIIVISVLIIASSTRAMAATMTPVSIVATSTAEASTTLLFLGNQNRAPVFFLKGTAPSGIAVDIVHEMAKHISQPIEIRAMDWTAAQTLLTESKADALVHINPTEERKNIYDFSDPFLESKLSIFTRSETVGVSGISNLRGLRVGVETESLPQKMLATEPAIKVASFPNIVDGLKQLSAGTLDAVVVDYRFGTYALAENNIQKIKVSSEPLALVYPAFAVKKGDIQLLNEINAALKIIKADGSYDKILENWESADVIFQTQEQITHEIYFAIIVILLILFVAALTWNIFTRREITRRREAEDALRSSTKEREFLFESSRDALMMLAPPSWKFTGANKATLKLFGASSVDEFTKLGPWDVSPERQPDGRLSSKVAQEMIEKAMSEGSNSFEWTHKGLDGQPFTADVLLTRTENEEVFLQATVRDITARKEEEEILRRSEYRLKEAQELTHLGNWNLDLVSNALSWSDEIYRIFEIDPKLFGATYDAFLNTIHPDDRGMVNTAYTESVKTHIPYDIDHRLLMKDGRTKYVHERCETFYDKDGKGLRSVGTVQDITDRRKAEEALRIASAYNRSLIEASLDPLVTISPKGKITDVNDATEYITGYSEEELVGKDFSDYFTDPKKATAVYLQVFETGEVKDYALEIKHKDGHSTPVLYNASLYKDADGNIIGIFAAARDITESKKAESSLNATNQALRMLSTTNEALIHATNEEALHQRVCDIMVNEGGYLLAWIGHIEHNGTNAIHAEAQAGHDEGYVNSINITWAKNEGGCGPECTAIRTQQPVVIHDITNDPLMAPWRDGAMKHGYRSMVAFPLLNDGVAFAVLSVYSSSSDAFGENTMRILKEMVEDLSFGVTALRTRKELKKVEERFHQSMETARDAIIIMGPDQRVSYWNKAAEQIFGYTEKEAVGQQVHSIIAPSQDQKSFMDQFLQSQETGEGAPTGRTREITARHKDGREIPVELSVSATQIEGKGYITGIMRDITERKKAEEEHQSNLKYMESMDKINSAIQKAENPEQMMSDVLDTLLDIFEADRAWLLTPTEPWITSYRIPMERARPGYPGALSMGMEIPVDPDATRLLEIARATNGPVTFDAESDPPLPLELTKHFHILSQIVIDIYPKVEASWMLGLHQCSYKRIWTNNEKKLFQEIGRRVSDSLTALLVYRDLKNKEREYRRIVETANEGIVVLDKEQKLSFVNDRLLNMLGYEAKDMLSHKFENFLAPHDIADHKNKMIERHQGKSDIYERQFLHKNGDIILCSISAVPLYDDKKDFDGSFGMVTDITERRNTEEKLQEQVKFSESLLRFSRDIEQTQAYGEALAAAQREIGTIIGYKNVWAYTVSEDKKYAHSIVASGPTAPIVMSKEGVETIPVQGDAMMEKIVSSKEIVVVEDAQTDPTVNKEIVAKIGNRTIVNVPIILFNRNLGSIGMGTFGDEGIRVPTAQEAGYLTAMASHMAVAFDRIRLLEETRKSTESLISRTEELANLNKYLKHEKAEDEALLSSLGEGMIATDTEGKIITMNRMAEKILGWKEAEVLGKIATKIIPAVDESGNTILAENRICSIVASGKSTKTLTGSVYLVKKNGDPVPVSETATSVILNNKNTGVVIIFRDITIEKEIEKTRGDLLALASHQLRTPLSGTKWLIETLQKGLQGELNKGQKEYLAEIYKINERMTTLVVDMLGVLRMEGGSIQIVKRPVFTTAILDALVETFDPVAKSRQITLNINKGNELTITTDIIILRNIIECFVSNAINYSEEGDTVVVSVHKEQDDIVFSVKDSGIGIPKDEQARLFERFYRASNAKIFNTKGTGLGLYIAAILAKKIDARISFESEEGSGSTFYLRIPVTKENELNK